jgi:hypothetical protein
MRRLDDSMSRLNQSKRFVRRVVFLLFLVLLLAPVGMAVADYEKHRIRLDCSAEMTAYLLQIQQQPVSVAQAGVLPVPVDGFHVVGPYLPSRQQADLVGVKWYPTTTFVDHLFSQWHTDGASLQEDRQTLVFVKDGHPVCMAVVSREIGDLVLGETDYLSVEERLFSRSEPETPTYWRVYRQTSGG